MKLTEFKGEDALDKLADIIEPLNGIITDEDVKEKFKAGKKVSAVAAAIKRHKAEVISVLATLDGVTVEEEAASLNIFTLPKKVIEILNDPDFEQLFS